MSGRKIIDGLEAAARGDFSRVTIAGHVWIRDGVDKADAWDAVTAARADEREQCAKIAENCFGGRAHTYASENADRYIIQDETCGLIAQKIRRRAPPPRETGER